jgi:uncharacterized protein (TIGR02270 family)
MLSTTHLPVVRRHLEDAAFYWQQLDTSHHEHGLRAQRLLHFARLLAAHLEGVQVARNASVPFALDALSRWRKPGEAFAAMYAALTSSDGDAPAQVMALVARDPSGLLRGVIGALVMAPERAAHAWVQHVWQQEPSPHGLAALVAALRACTLRDWPIPADAYAHAIAHTDAFVRAAALRSLREPQTLLVFLEDTDLAVRAEAAIALGQTVHGEPHHRLQAVNTLWEAVRAQAQYCQEATGWLRMQSQRRLLRWLCHLAHLTPLGHPDIPALLAQVPLRPALDFVLHHGDAALLPFVLKAMDHPDQARRAGFVWSGLTGIDLLQAGMTQPEPDVDLDAPLTRLQQDADQGLPLPNAEAVRSHGMSAGFPQGQALLLGRPRTTAHLAEVLRISTNAPQVLRAVAAQSWNAQRCSSFIFKIRASAVTLLQQDQALPSA